MRVFVIAAALAASGDGLLARDLEPFAIRVLEDSLAGCVLEIDVDEAARLDREEPVTKELLLAVAPGSADACRLEVDAVAGQVRDPGSLARIVGRGTIRDIDFVRLSLRPVERDASGVIRVARSMRLRLTFDDRVAPGDVTDVVPAFAGIYDNLFVNRWRDRVRPRAGSAANLAPSCIPPTLGGSAYRIRVDRDGVYRIGQAELDAKTDWVWSAVDPRNVRLYEVDAGGCTEIAILVQGQGDGSFDPGDYVELLGRARLGENDPAAWQRGDYGDERAYFLVPSTSPGLRMSVRFVNASLGPPLYTRFRDTLRFEQNPAFNPFIANAGEDVFVWKYAFYPLGDPQNSQQTHALDVPDPAGVGTVDVRAVLRGWTYAAPDPDHHAALILNGTTLVEETWDGQGEHAMDASGLPASVLLPSSTMVLEVFDPALIGVPMDGIYSNWFEIDYERLTRAAGGELRVKGPSAQTVKVTVSNLPSTDVTVLDVTDPQRPMRLVGATASGAGPYTLRYNFAFPAAGGTHYVASAPARRSPVSWRRAFADDLLSPGNGADWIAIGPQALLSTLSVPSLGALLTHRQASAGGALRVRRVDVEDVYDQFGNGTIDPQAIRDFLAHAYASWSAPAPAYVLLLGDASADYKNHLGFGWNNFVPSHVSHDPGDPYLAYHAEDTWYALLAGADNVPEMLVGRVPARTTADAEAFCRKVLSYETAPASGSWRGRTLFVADARDALRFEGDSEAMAALVTGPAPADKLYFGQPPWNGTNMDASPANGVNDIVDRLNGGALVTSFLGHGAFAYWGYNAEMMDTATAGTCANPDRPSIILNGSCYTGGFQNPNVPALMETFVLAPDKGAVGAGAESSWSWTFDGIEQVEPFVGGVYGMAPLRILGSLIQLVHANLDQPGNGSKARGFIGFGDPATRLPMPLPERPGNLRVTATGSRLVSLAWGDAHDPALTYAVRRAPAGTGNYATVASGVAPTAFDDTTGTNLVPYDYYVVALDAEGYWSAASNVVQATPENPNPPAVPTGLVVTDLALGKRLVASWNPSPEPDVTKYTVNWTDPLGTTLSKDVAVPATSTTIYGLRDGTAYDVRVTATNDSLRTSAPSPPVAGTPTHGLGYTPPRWVSDLQWNRVGTTVTLTWTRIETNVYGEPEPASTYSIYRTYVSSPVPDRSPGSGDRVATVTCANPGTCTEVLTLNMPPETEVFNVTGYDAQNEESPIGHQMPDVVSEVSLRVISPTRVRVSWDPCTTDLDGNAATIQKYRVYRGAAPNPRPDYIGASNLLGETVGLLFFDNAASPAEPYYTVIAADELNNPGPF